MRRLIGVDLTGVLEDPWPLKRQWFCERGYDFGATPMSRGAILVEIDGDTALYERMLEWVYSEGQIPYHAVMPGAYDALSALASEARFVILTSRLPRLRKVTTAWLEKNGFLSLTGEPVMLGDPLYFPDDDHRPGSKLSWCVRRGAIALIDDSLRNLEPSVRVPRSERITRILFGDYVRNRDPSSTIVTAADWPTLQPVLATLLQR